MTITRDGNEYTLTDRELWNAFREALAVRYRNEIESYYDTIDELVSWRETNADEYAECVDDCLEQCLDEFDMYGEILLDDSIHWRAGDAIDDHGINEKIYEC